MPTLEDDDLDRPIYGVKAIALVLNLPERKAFYALEKGYADADKWGKIWRSTRRRLLAPRKDRGPVA